MRVGDVFRYPRLGDARKELDAGGSLDPVVDGLPNFLYATLARDGTLTGLERGISPIRRVAAVDGERTPAILIRSSPHKTGSETTPWQDQFDPDVGYVRYYGDAKPGQPAPPEKTPGNSILLAQAALHTSPDPRERARGAPVLLFLSVREDGRVKGQVAFQGAGVVTSASRVVQQDPRTQQTFTNYRFEFTVLDLAPEDDQVDWGWVDARRDKTLSTSETLLLAPASWKRWVQGGSDTLGTVRRRVAKLRTVARDAQLPEPGSRADAILAEVVRYYEPRKHRFEALAEAVTEHVVRDSGADYRRGWITPQSSDGGADFIGRIDLGSGFAGMSLVVLGQAKCVSPSSASGGLHLARVVARLRRGWIGAFVTTGHFSVPGQREVLEDRYPLILVNGRELAENVDRMMHGRALRDVSTFLDEIDRDYDSRVARREPESILLDE